MGKTVLFVAVTVSRRSQTNQCLCTKQTKLTAVFTEGVVGGFTGLLNQLKPTDWCEITNVHAILDGASFRIKRCFSASSVVLEIAMDCHRDWKTSPTCCDPSTIKTPVQTKSHAAPVLLPDSNAHPSDPVLRVLEYSTSLPTAIAIAISFFLPMAVALHGLALSPR